jgi:hypothetical protein
MSKQFIALAFLVLLFSFTSCKKDEDSASFDCATCVNTPVAVAAEDTKSGGVYKGTIVGSTGTITIYLKNGNAEIKATIVLDGVIYNLTTTGLADWTSGQGIEGATFTSGELSFTFSVGSDGGEPSVSNIVIPGHSNIEVNISKETSTELIRVFEGTYKKATPVVVDPLGTFNLVIENNEFSIVAKDKPREDKPNPEPMLITGGTVDANGNFELIILPSKDDDGTVTIKGKIVGDELSGTWENNNPTNPSGSESGTLSAKRTL